jgi:aspartyl protease family protein
MMRAVFLSLLAVGFFASLLTHLPPDSSSKSGDVIVDARDRAPPKMAALKAKTGAQFNSQDGSVELQRNVDGHFYADVRINGAPIRMLIDTGASGIALSREDVQMAGLATSIGMTDVVGEGASGEVRGEWVRLDRVELGPLSASNLDAAILDGGEQSLLGQSFLRKFGKVQIEEDRMVLR